MFSSGSFEGEDLRRHDGKQPHKFTYTYNDIAGLTNLSLNTVRAYASRKVYDAYDLASVISFVNRKSLKESQT